MANSDDLVSIPILLFGKTKDSENTRDLLEDTLNSIPQNVLKAFAGFGMKIVVAPTIVEALHGANSQIDGTLDINKRIRELYDPATKTICVAEGPIDEVEDVSLNEFVTMCARSYNHMTGIAESDEFCEALKYDFDTLPPHLVAAYGPSAYRSNAKRKLDSALSSLSTAGDRLSAYESVFRYLTMVLNGGEDDQYPDFMPTAGKALPRSTAILLKSINQVGASQSWPLR